METLIRSGISQLTMSDIAEGVQKLQVWCAIPCTYQQAYMYMTYRTQYVHFLWVKATCSGLAATLDYIMNPPPPYTWSTRSFFGRNRLYKSPRFKTKTSVIDDGPTLLVFYWSWLHNSIRKGSHFKKLYRLELASRKGHFGEKDSPEWQESKKWIRGKGQ